MVASTLAARHFEWLLLVVTALAFSPVWFAPALMDRPASCLWNAQPLVCLSFQLGPAAWFHVENLAVHLANVALALALFTGMMPRAAALLAAAWFALHPLQSEAVSFAAARPELLATFFALLATRAWVAQRHWIAALWFVPSLLCGGATAALPLFLLLFDFSRHAVHEEGLPALAVMSVASSWSLIWLSLSHAASSPVQQVLSAGPALGHFSRLLILPYGFTVWPDVDQSPAARFVAWMVIALLAGTALSAFDRLRLGFWFVAGLTLLAPVYVIFSGPAAAADPRMYLPMLAVAAFAGRVLESTQFPVLLAAGVLLLAGLTYSRGTVWHSEQALWEEAAHGSPLQLRPRLELARLATPRRALEMLLEAKDLYPDDGAVAAQLAGTYLALHLPGDAVMEYGRALALAPGRADLHLGRGQALARLNLNEAALTDFEQALAISPCSQQARAALNLPPCGSK